MYELPDDLAALLERLETAIEALGPITPETREKVSELARAALALQSAPTEWASLCQRAKLALERIEALGDPRAWFAGVSPAGLEEAQALAWATQQVERAEYRTEFWESTLAQLRAVLDHDKRRGTP